MFTLVLVNASILLTIITLNIHWRHPNTHHMPNWVKRWFFEIIPPFILMSKPHIANAILRSKEEKDDNEENEPRLSQTDHHIHRLNNYLKTVSIDKYPPVIQQAIRDIRYISETQREAQKDDLVCWKRKEDSSIFIVFFFLNRNEKVGDLLPLFLIDVV